MTLQTGYVMFGYGELGIEDWRQPWWKTTFVGRWLPSLPYLHEYTHKTQTKRTKSHAAQKLNPTSLRFEVFSLKRLWDLVLSFQFLPPQGIGLSVPMEWGEGRNSLAFAKPSYKILASCYTENWSKSLLLGKWLRHPLQAQGLNG